METSKHWLGGPAQWDDDCAFALALGTHVSRERLVSAAAHSFEGTRLDADSFGVSVFSAEMGERMHKQN